jgi:hypothetical protein
VTTRRAHSPSRSRALRLLSAAGCAWLATAIPAQDAVRAFERAFEDPRDNRAETVAARLESLRALRGVDSPALADAVVGVWSKIDHEMSSVERRHVALLGPEPADALADLRVDLDSLLRQLGAVERLLDGLEEPETIEALFARLGRSRGIPLSLRLSIARRCGPLRAEALFTLMRRLELALHDDDRAALLIAAAAIGERAAPACRDLSLTDLGHADPAVRVAAADALAAMHAPAAIPPLVDALADAIEDDTPRLPDRFADALATLTGFDLGPSPFAWRRWQQDHAEMLVRGRLPPPPEAPTRRASAPSANGSTRAYYGIPQSGRAILYVIDVSGSMDSATASQRRTDVRTRIELARAELFDAIAALPQDRRFDVLLFSSGVTRVFGRLVPPDRRAIEEVRRVVGETPVGGRTALFDALEASFVAAGRSAGPDRDFEPEIDTIFVLTDGVPTRTDGLRDDTGLILRAVRRWNALERVVVHAIALDTDRSFLERLAEQNGGVFVDA